MNMSEITVWILNKEMKDNGFSKLNPGMPTEFWLHDAEGLIVEVDWHAREFHSYPRHNNWSLDDRRIIIPKEFEEEKNEDKEDFEFGTTYY